MRTHETGTLRSVSRNLAVAACVVLIAFAAATAFAVGFSHSLEDSLANPASAPALRIAALERIRDSLGYDGFLKAYREGAEAPDLAKLANDADTALANLRAADESERDAADARAVAALVAKFHDAARDRLIGAPSPDSAVLEQGYATLKLRIAEAIAAAHYRRIEAMSHSLATAQTTAVLTGSALSLTLFALAWYLRTRLLDPLRALRRSAEAAADAGAPARHLWGIERGDEIGALARAVDRLRRQARHSPEPEEATGGMHAVLENLNRPPGEIPSAGRLQAELQTILETVNDTRRRIDEASREAARASQTAVEAADLARLGAERLSTKADSLVDSAGTQTQALVAALNASIGKLGDAVARFDQAPAGAGAAAPGHANSIPDRARSLLSRIENTRDQDDPADAERSEIESNIYAALSRLAEANEAGEPDSAASLAELAADLDRLEVLANRDSGFAEGEAATLTACLIEAIDRLNNVVQRVSASSRTEPMRNHA